MYEFISYVEINNIKIYFNNFDYAQKKEMMNGFIINFKNKIQNKILELCNLLIDEELLDIWETEIDMRKRDVIIKELKME